MLLSILLANPAWSQTRPDAGLLLNDSTRSNRPAPSTAIEAPVLDTPVRPVISLPEGITLKVTSFRISGAISFPESVLQSLVAPWLGKTLDINALNEATGAITRHYQSQGHILTYAYLPAQKITDETIEIAVMEGHLDNVQIVAAQDVRLKDEVVQAHMGRLSQASTVEQPALERQLLLLNDIPGVVARGSFTPGGSTGQADLVVSVAEEEPLTSTFELSNHGVTSTGTHLMGASFHFKDLFGVGDSTRARFSTSQTANMVNASINTRIPVGGNGWTVGAGLSRLSYALSGSFAALGGVGEASVLTFNTTYPLLRSFSRNLNVEANLANKQLLDEIQLTGLSTPKESTVVGISLIFDQRDPWLGNGSMNASLSLSQGDLRFKDSAQQAADLLGLQTAGSFNKLNFDVSRRQYFGQSWNVLARMTGQQTSKNLDSTEKFSLTGPSGLRSYAVGEASVDQGRYFDIELGYTQTYVGGMLQWSIFHERAWGRLNTQPKPGVLDNDVTLYGSGLGLQWNGGAGLGLNASLAWRGNGSRPPSAGNTDTPRLYLQLSKNL